MSITAQTALFADGFDYGGGTPMTPAKAHVTGDGAMVFTRTDYTVTAVTVTDTAANTYVEVGSALFGVIRIHAHRCLSMTGHATNVLSATVGTGPGAVYTIAVLIFRTTNAPFLLLAHAEGTSSGTPSGTLDSGTLSYASQASVIGAGMSASNPGFTAGSGFTLTNQSDGAGGYFAWEHQVVSATVNATAAASGVPNWGIAALAFGETAPAGGSGVFRPYFALLT